VEVYGIHSHGAPEQASNSIESGFLSRKGFNLKKRPIELTLNVLHRFLERVTQNLEPCNVEKSRVEKNREEKNIVEAEEEKLIWNHFCEDKRGMSIRELTGTRKEFLARRRKNPSFNMQNIVDAIAEQPFLLGQNDRGWVVSFDWIIANDTNFVKVLEHRYKEKNPKDEIDALIRSNKEGTYVASNKLSTSS
jgi:hypothetical protein